MNSSQIFIFTKHKTWIFLLTLPTVADTGNSGDAGSSDKVYELKISTSQTEQALITRNYQKLADELNEKSGGRLKVTVFPAGQ